MQPIQRLMVNICSEQLEKSKVFYARLFDLQIGYESDWFIQLTSASGLEIGLIQQSNDLVPELARAQPAGVYMTFVVENIEQLFSTAKEAEMIILQAPKDTPYGQRRMLLQDPNGLVVDISSPIADFKY